jgi:hypothetical protein
MWPFSKTDKLVADATRLVGMINDLWEGHYVPRKAHEARVKDLLDNTDREVARRKVAMKEAAEAEKDTMRALSMTRDNKALVKAVDWASDELKTSPCTAGHVFDCIKVFCMGYNHKTIITSGLHVQLLKAYQAGADLAAKDRALVSTAEAAGLMTRNKDKTA